MFDGRLEVIKILICKTCYCKHMTRVKNDWSAFVLSVAKLTINRKSYITGTLNDISFDLLGRFLGKYNW